MTEFDPSDLVHYIYYHKKYIKLCQLLGAFLINVQNYFSFPETSFLAYATIHNACNILIIPNNVARCNVMY